MDKDLEKAKQEYFRKGGKVTVLPPGTSDGSPSNSYLHKPKDGIDFEKLDSFEEDFYADN